MRRRKATQGHHQWSNVDLDRGVITFTQSKTQKEVQIPIHPDLGQWLRTNRTSITRRRRTIARELKRREMRNFHRNLSRTRLLASVYTPARKKQSMQTIYCHGIRRGHQSPKKAERENRRRLKNELKLEKMKERKRQLAATSLLNELLQGGSD